MNEITVQIGAAALAPVSCDAEGTITGRYLFKEGFAGFNGHFPGHPILPAIVEVLTAVTVVGEHLGQRQRLMALEDAKFLKPVFPSEELVVRCRPREVKGKLLYEAELKVGESASATLLMALAPATETA